MSTFKIETVVLSEETEISEDQVVEYAAKTPEDFKNYMFLEGKVTFVIGDVRLGIEDTLSYVLPTLAMEALPDLVNDGEVKLLLQSNPEKFYLKSDGTTVTMTGNYLTEPLEFQQDDLVAASMDACRRFLTWAEKIWPDIGISDDLDALKAIRAELVADG